MLPSPLTITGMGVASALGGAVTACAAARAGMSRPRTLAFEVHDKEAAGLVPVVGYTMGDATLGFAEVGLATRMAALALSDLLSRTPIEPAELRDMAVLINLPSGYYL